MNSHSDSPEGRDTGSSARMDEATFRQFIYAAMGLSVEYAVGYATGLRRYHNGERYPLPADVEALADTGVFGERAVGFSDGLAGKPPGGLPLEYTAYVHLRIPFTTKALWAQESRVEGLKLNEWIVAKVNASLQQRV